MSIDKLHERIRKYKNPLVVDFAVKDEMLPQFLLDEEGSVLLAYTRFCRELLEGLADSVPGVRFSFDTFALFGEDGLRSMRELLQLAEEKGFFVILDSPQILTPWGADRAADGIFGSYPCDAQLFCPYVGSDAVRPFLPYCKDSGKSVFAVVRSPNRSAAEFQDLLSGSRLVQSAVAEMVNRFGDPMRGKCGYCQVAAAVSAGHPDSLRTLRAKYNRMFLLVDGLDYPSGNAKNCSYAFDRFGYGAAVCAGPSVTCAWKNMEMDETDFVLGAQQAAERIKRNILRYITIL